MIDIRTGARVRDAILRHLADGEWHGHHELVRAVKQDVPEQAVRIVLREMRSTREVEREDRRMSYRHGASWFYRLRGKGE